MASDLSIDAPSRNGTSWNPKLERQEALLPVETSSLLKSGPKRSPILFILTNQFTISARSSQDQDQDGRFSLASLARPSDMGRDPWKIRADALALVGLVILSGRKSYPI